MNKSTALIRLAVAALLFAAVFLIQVPAARSAECTEGQYRTVIIGPYCSCDDRGTPKERDQCIGGVWEYLYSFCAGPYCPE